MQNILLTLLGTDGYKLGHREQYPDGTNIIFSNLTPRGSEHPLIKDEIEVFGLDYVIKLLKEEWDKFFNLTSTEAIEVINEFKTIIETYLGTEYKIEHLIKLHSLGKLPLEIYGLPNYYLNKLNQPVFVIWNTDPDSYWLVNYLETWLLAHSWQMITSANVSRTYRDIMDKYAAKTASKFHEEVLVNYQGHDFSYRGMSSNESAIFSGLGHLAHFKGTDTLPAMHIWNDLYKKDGDLEVMSVNATEHSTMTAAGKENELETYSRLLDIYPNGILSVVSDTWDLWNVLTNILPKLREKIMNRDGKLVIRPDSGNPVNIICGTLESNPETPEEKGLIRLLEETFGSTINEKGYKVLDSHIGAIQGDSMTIEVVEQILSKLERRGYSSENIVFGIGASTYQKLNRDTFKFAMKATAININGEWKEIYKDPITDPGKKSARGILNIVGGKLIQHSSIVDIKNKSDFIKLL